MKENNNEINDNEIEDNEIKNNEINLIKEDYKEKEELKNEKEGEINEKEDNLLLKIKISNKTDEEKYNPLINYLSINPFVKYAKTGFGITVCASYGICFTYTNFVVPTLIFSTIGAIGAAIFIPSLIGLGIYSLKKKRKNEKYRRIIESLNNNNLKEEKEIIEEIIRNFKEEISNLFMTDFLKQYNFGLNDRIINYIKNFIKMKNVKSDKLISTYQKEIRNISTLNVILLGKSGVGKSTLINEILQLKNNKAKEQDKFQSMHINGWIKKYPVNEEDSKIKKINLWDTEGIEFSNENKNNLENHLKKVINHIKTHNSIPNEQINCIWYCINGQTFQPSEEKYIEKLLVSYNEKFKIPIIFVYTQAYDSERNRIEGIKDKLENWQFIKDNKNSFHFIEIISKEHKYKNRKGKENIEEPFNLENLIKETNDLSKEGMDVVTLDKINKFCFSLNEIALNFENNLFNRKIRLFNDILNIKNQNIIQIFESTNQSLIKLIKKFFEGCEENLKGEINNSINEIIKIIEISLKEKIKTIINSRNLNYICETNKNFIESKYNLKEAPEKTLEQYKEEINEFIIKPIFYSQNNFGIIEIYDKVINLILTPLFEKYNEYLDTKKNYMKNLMLGILEENYNNFKKNVKI